MPTVRDDSVQADTSPASVADHPLVEPWKDHEEIHALPEIMRPAEELAAVAVGTVIRSGRLAQSRWLVVVSDRRLVCLKGADPASRRVIEMPISAIRSVEAGGLLQSTISLETGYGTLRISGMPRSAAGEVVSALTSLMDGGRADGASAGDENLSADGRLTAAELTEMRDTLAGLRAAVKELTRRVEEVEARVGDGVPASAPATE